MLKDFSWNVFEKTGSIESFLLYNTIKKQDKEGLFNANQGAINQGNQME